MVAFNVDTNEWVCGKRAYFEVFAREFNYFHKNCILVAQYQAIIYVQDEEGCFLIWLSRTEVSEVTLNSLNLTFQTREACFKP
jgi:hypothetical protein